MSNTSDDWRPIKTAPKDGTRIVLYREGFAESMAIAWYDKEYECPWIPVNGTSFPEPTHWKPCPDVPKVLPKLNKVQKRMQEIVARFQHYVATYTNQAYYTDYADKTFVHDMLYGIGIALDPEKFHMSSGFEKFKTELRNEYVNDDNA